jgi:hypothetical protein
VRLFKKSEAFLKHFKWNRGFFHICEEFWTTLRLFKNIFRELEAFDYKCEAFIKTTRLFENIFREMEALFINLRLFQRLQGSFKIRKLKSKFILWAIRLFIYVWNWSYRLGCAKKRRNSRWSPKMVFGLTFSNVF